MPVEVPFFFPGMMMMMLAGAAMCVGFMMFRRQSRRGFLGRGESERVLDAIDELRADVDELRHEMTDMNERLDFTERVLARPPESASRS